jgi:ABC-type sugar transport system ATPase subunit
MVEIAKALRSEARVLILDEPTAVLSLRETDHLFGILKDLRNKGLGLVYVSHRLDEIFEICTHITVIKDGEVTTSGRVEEFNHDKVVTAMVGRSLGDMFPAKSDSRKESQTALEVQDLVVKEASPPISLNVKRGEIVGLSGLVGSGRTETALAIFGANPSQGRVVLNGKDHQNRSPAASLSSRMAMLTESRKVDGLFLESSVALNFAATTLSVERNPLALSPSGDEKRAIPLKQLYHVTADNVGMPVSRLSGGNQQKVLIGRLLESKPEVLILDEPTRGVDVGAKAEIYRSLRQIADSGVGILVISSELIEIVGLCDRVYIMRDGIIAAELKGSEISERAIISIAAAGGDSVGNDGQVQARG